MVRLFAFILLLGAAHADSSLPLPAEGWAGRCAARLDQAARTLAREVPAFADAKARVDAAGKVTLAALVPDAEHARFYDGKPARFTAEIKAKASAEPGTIGGRVGNEADHQASYSLSRWTRTRLGTLDVQVADGRTVARFQRAFEPALDDCLR